MKKNLLFTIILLIGALSLNAQIHVNDNFGFCVDGTYNQIADVDGRVAYQSGFGTVIRWSSANNHWRIGSANPAQTAIYTNTFNSLEPPCSSTQAWTNNGTGCGPITVTGAGSPCGTTLAPSCGGGGSAGLWVGCASDGLWTTASNWDNGAVPTASDNVTIDLGETITVSGAAYARSITLSNGAELIVSASGSLTASTAANSSSGDAIRLNSGTSLTNSGTITITNSGDDGIQCSGGTLTNESSGSIVLDACAFDFYFLNSAQVTNHGTISSSNAVNDGLYNRATLTNESGGSINISNAGAVGLYNYEGLTTNYGTITVTSSGGDGIRNRASLINEMGGSINITGAGSEGFFNYISSAQLTNSGTITITGSTAADLKDLGTFTNNLLLEVKGTMTGISSLGGTLAPGNSVGALSTDQGLTLTETIEMEVDDPTTFDVLNSTGGGILDLSAATLDFIFAGVANDYTNGDKFQLFSGFTTVTAAGSMTNNLGLTIVDNGDGEYEIIAGALLPVELISFTARAEKENVILKWETATEINNEGFFVERSIDGIAWEELGFVAGAGNTETEQSYTYTDARPISGKSYYRLRQVDFDGAFAYSKLVALRISSNASTLMVFPNPTKGMVNIRFEMSADDVLEFEIKDITGKTISSLSYEALSGLNNLQIDITDLVTGIYFLSLNNGKSSEIFKIIKD